MKLNKFFTLTWKKLWIVVVTGFVSIILHNLVGALIGLEEAFFFIIAVFLVPGYILIAVPFTLLNLFKNRR
jgi:hypothetical protein